MITLETRSECEFYAKIIDLMKEVKQALEEIVGKYNFISEFINKSQLIIRL